MDKTAIVRRLVDRILLAAELDPVLHLLADDLSFKVAIPGAMPICFADSGKQGVVDYFTALGGIVTFWQVKYFAEGEQVIAVGRERFTVETCELTADSDFALVFDVHDGLITRLLVVEDLSSFLKDGNQVLELANRLQDPLAPTVYRTAGAGAEVLLPA
ncbi:MAG TPA: nuclear transport factor 2 family protein [Gemmatimonadales bacterium]|jgi:ketosteroid isomerase-like protein|nr:nuclear transport factor 2 family protein [Gemmatimonadales bacterium]